MFTDYRAYLVAHAQEMRAQNPRWTFGAWARRLGLKSTSSITKVIQGKREPGERITQQLIRYFGFNETDAQYFADLVRLHKIRRDPRLSVSLLEKMQKDLPDGSVRIFDDRTFTIISQWYCLAVREMACLDGFLEDPGWISKRFRFKVTSREASRAIKLLLELGLLGRDPQGRLQVTDERVHTQSDVASEAIKRFHEQMLDNAKAAIRSVAIEEREYLGATLVMPKDRMPEAKELIREFRRRFSRTFEGSSGDTVYQLQLQLFPLTRPITKEREDD